MVAGEVNSEDRCMLTHTTRNDLANVPVHGDDNMIGWSSHGQVGIDQSIV